MEVSTWSPGHDRIIHTPLLSPRHAQFDTNFQSLRRSLSRSPSRTDLSQLHARLSRRSTPKISRFCGSPVSSLRQGSSLTEAGRSQTKPAPLSLSRTSPIKIPDFGSHEGHRSRTGDIRQEYGEAPLGSATNEISAHTTPLVPSHSKTGRNAIRRALSVASDNGNSTTPRSSLPNADGQENQQSSGSFDAQKGSKVIEPPIFRLESPRSITPRFRSRSREWRPAKSSPLKRSDALINLNHATSPAAKRRTICAGQISSPFEMFRDTPDGDSMEATDSEAEVTSNDTSIDLTTALNMRNTRRSAPSGQRSDNLIRPRRSLDRQAESPRRPKPGLRQRLRLFNEPILTAPQSTERVQIFSDPPVYDTHDEPKATSDMRMFRANQPHPLSQALSPTSPTPPASFGSGIKDPVDACMVNAEPTTKLDFSKSLPIGAIRQHEQSRLTSLQSSHESSQESFETPRSYQMARPNPAAFRSTGLISKKHRNAEDLPPPPDGKNRMPDTPIKKGLTGFTFGASPTPVHATFKEPIFAQPSFDTPSRPFNLAGNRRCHTSLKGSNIFGRNTNYTGLSRCESFASLDGDDFSQPLSQQDSQSSTDDLPPTPTKEVRNTKSGSLRSSLFGRHPPLASNVFQAPEASEQDSGAAPLVIPDSQCEYASLRPALRGGGISAKEFDLSGRRLSTGGASALVPRAALARHSLSMVASDDRSALPSKLSIVHASPLHREQSAKTAVPTTVFRTSFPFGTAQNIPQTPADNGFPDPSGLSISPNWRDQASPLGTRYAQRSSIYTPATPTHRDSHTIPATPRAIVTPSHRGPPEELDPVLVKRFRKVEKVAEGEFSDVFKVYEAPRRSYFETKRADDLYAVKKSKIPYHSVKMRESQLREAQIMKDLSMSVTEGSEHVVKLFDSWEASGHTYFKIEFCNDGNLEEFLDKIGNRDRLDDFRIWKILREACLGLLHIHDSGYIHLDLKPANIFIAFNGALKIGDFGLACSWPAPAHTEGEGDRRYIAPELLRGQIDKPADVFALGLIIFEIASNKVLPNNGKSWQKLRSGDWSDLEKSDEKSLTTLPSLTSGSTNSLSRESQASSRNIDCTSHENLYSYKDSSMDDVVEMEEPATPPAFVLDSNDPQSLDSIVHWMMHPDPDQRPTVHQILETAGCQWVNARSRAAGATIDEGPWGPPLQQNKDQMDQDSVMLDV